MAARRDEEEVTSWARRTRELYEELAAIAEVDARWWLLAGGVALAEMRTLDDVYLASDAEPDGDTFMAYRRDRPRDLVDDAIARARAARTAIRELDGTLPGQPLAVTIERYRGGCVQPSRLDTAAFAVGETCLVGSLDDERLPAQLARVLAGQPAPRWTGATPFVCVSIGDEPIETARHGHRRAWTERGGPWLGLSRAGDLAVVSTCHLVTDGFGHAHLTARIAALAPVSPAPAADDAPPLTHVRGAVPLAIAYRVLHAPTPRLIPLVHALGRLLHADLASPAARFSPTIQIPVARGHRDDPLRLRRRIVSATTSVRFTRGIPEPLRAFEARVRAALTREAESRGLVSRLLAAARAAPVPLAWKRRSISAKRPRWLEDFAEVIGGRALVSRIAVEGSAPPLFAVSSPARMATANDVRGGLVVTLVESSDGAAITLAGSGHVGTPQAAERFLDRLLALATA